MPEQTPNLRDLGGLRAAHGAFVRPGTVFRSAVPFADDEPAPGMTWPPSEVIDLRSAGELAAGHPLAATGSQIHNVPLLAALSPEAWGVETLRELYLHVLKDVPDRLAHTVDLVARGGGPTLIHCAAGKDRTGVSVALILRLLGVDREAVTADYLITRSNEPQIRKRLDAVRTRGHVIPDAFLQTPVEAITAVLDVWEAHPYGVEGWVRDAGVETDTLQVLRERLVTVPG